jgi:single-strand DNA-binding protein
MFNRVILIGNLTRDVELRYTNRGTAVANTGLAVNRKFKDPTTGELKEETLFIDLTIFGRSAEVANQYLTKGRRILVEGRLALDQWTAPDGTRRSKHYVVVERLQFMDSRQEGVGMGQPAGMGPQPTDPYAQPNYSQPGGGYPPMGPAPTQTPPPMGGVPPHSHLQSSPTGEKGGATGESGPQIPTINLDEEDLPF